ncbi:hypothetical protein [Mucilaginibacter sp.]|uniref:hypothetical protein n=1 Tax=Mucilaginibacter sp. TaxID=1882438 RepID=UPI00260001D1|nr:hypothetical protein [Mucilaginibacter sp.]
MTKESIIEEIIEGILSFRIIPFFGAGMSIPARAADWPGLINEPRSAIQTEETDYLKVAQLYEEKFGRHALLEKLIRLCTLQRKSSSTQEKVVLIFKSICYLCCRQISLNSLTI